MESRAKKMFVCQFSGCQASFRRRDKLDIHTRLHTGERPFICDYPECTKSFIRSQHLIRHVQRVHEKVEHQERLKCDNCDQDFATTDTLHKHLKTVHHHRRAKLYKCMEEGCGEVFHKKKQLQVHGITHTGHLSLSAKCYKCLHADCGKSFIYPSKLKAHMKVHEGYPCDIDGCEAVLPNWSKLRKHKADIHASKKCPECGTMFKQKSSLDLHRKTHDEERDALVCPEEGCGRIYFYMKNLRQHIRAFHNKERVWKKKKQQTKTKKKEQKKRPKKSIAAKLMGLDDRKKLIYQDHSEDILTEDAEMDVAETAGPSNLSTQQPDSNNVLDSVTEKNHPQVESSQCVPQTASLQKLTPRTMVVDSVVKVNSSEMDQFKYVTSIPLKSIGTAASVEKTLVENYIQAVVVPSADLVNKENPLPSNDSPTKELHQELSVLEVDPAILEEASSLILSLVNGEESSVRSNITMPALTDSNSSTVKAKNLML